MSDKATALDELEEMHNHVNSLTLIFPLKYMPDFIREGKNQRDFMFFDKV